MQIMRSHTPISLEYLHSRGLTDYSIAKARLGYVQQGRYKQSISIPYMNPDGSVRFTRYRYLYPRKFKYDQPEGSGIHLYNIQGTLKPHILCCEGEFDSIILQQFFRELGIHDCGVVAAPGTHGFNASWRYLFANAKTVQIIADGDKAGQEGASRTHSILGGLTNVRCLVINMPEGQDVNSQYLKDPAELRRILRLPSAIVIASRQRGR